MVRHNWSEGAVVRHSVSGHGLAYLKGEESPSNMTTATILL